MRLLASVVLLLFTQFIQPHPTGNAPSKQCYEQEHITNGLNFIVGVWESAIDHIQAENQQQASYNAQNDCLYRIYLGATIAGVIGGVIGVGLIFWQTILLKQTVNSSVGQAQAMERHIVQAARSASAMEAVGESLKVTAQASSDSVKGLKQQMRAYINVGVGFAVPQDRVRNVKFQAVPTLVNNGLTPAHKVVYKTKAAILPVPLPSGFNFPLPTEDSGENMMGPRQTATLSPIVDDFVSDALVADIKKGHGMGLYVWGTIGYVDVFGDAQQTRFCQHLTWLQDGTTLWGYFVPGHNDGT
jgi:hypothetical protein